MFFIEFLYIFFLYECTMVENLMIFPVRNMTVWYELVVQGFKVWSPVLVIFKYVKGYFGVQDILYIVGTYKYLGHHQAGLPMLAFLKC